MPGHRSDESTEATSASDGPRWDPARDTEVAAGEDRWRGSEDGEWAGVFFVACSGLQEVNVLVYQGPSMIVVRTVPKFQHLKGPSKIVFKDIPSKAACKPDPSPRCRLRPDRDARTASS